MDANNLALIAQLLILAAQPKQQLEQLPVVQVIECDRRNPMTKKSKRPKKACYHFKTSK